MFKKIFFGLFIYFLLLINAYAGECTYDVKAMYMKDAAKINVHYEESGTNLNVVIEGLNNKFYIKTQSRNIDEEASSNFQERIYGNSNGEKQSIMWYDTSSILEVTFDIYGSDFSSCPNEKLSSTKIILPKYNIFSTEEKCIDNPDVYVCKKFVTSNISQSEFDRAFEKKMTIDVDKTDDDSNVIKESAIEKFIRENKTFIIIGTFLVVFGVTTGIILYKRKNSMF